MGAENQGAGNGECLTPKVNIAIIRALFNAEVQEKKLAYRVISMQLVITLIAAAIVFGLMGSLKGAFAVISGGGVSVLNSFMLAWRMSRYKRDVHDAHHQLRLMYFYAAERFLLVVVMLATCMAVIRDSMPAVLGGFILGQVVLLVARLFFRIKFEGGLKNVQ